MKKDKEYKRVKFPVEVLKEASELFDKICEKASKKNISLALRVDVEDASWTHDSEEEFFADYRKCAGWARYERRNEVSSLGYPSLEIIFYGRIQGYEHTLVSVKVQKRDEIERVFSIFEKHVKDSMLPEPPPEPPHKEKIFIGHGRDRAWKELKDHLHEMHGFDIEAYEIGARAGHAVRDILSEMMEESSFALLVMTGEDRMKDGTMRPRENVIHEAGLFQGRLGFERAIILLEKGIKEFSNIQGIHQIRFQKGNIKETFGDVVATLNREFASSKNE